MFEIGKEYKLRNGMKARVYALDGEAAHGRIGDQSVHGAYLLTSGWCVASWSEDGKSLFSDRPHDFDLMPPCDPPGVVLPPIEWRDRPHWHWLRAERASNPSIAEWHKDNSTGVYAWWPTAEPGPVSPVDMSWHGWRYWKPVLPAEPTELAPTFTQLAEEQCKHHWINAMLDSEAYKYCTRCQKAMLLDLWSKTKTDIHAALIAEARSWQLELLNRLADALESK